MNENVIRLASSREAPIRRACRDCRFYVPDTGFGATKRRFSISLWPPRIRTWLEQTADAHRYAVCSAVGGYYVQVERGDSGDCGPEGKFFDPRPAPSSEPER